MRGGEIHPGVSPKPKSHRREEIKMKDTLLNFLLLLFLVGTACPQNVALPPPPDKDPSVGVWSKNKDKSQPITEGTNVLEETYDSETVARDGDDIVVTEKIGPRRWRGGSDVAKATKRTFKLRCDGSLHPLPGGSGSCNYVGANIVEGKTTYSRDDVIFPRHTTFFWRTEISADGKEMRDSSYKDAAMTKRISLTVFDRVK
jgi:hypothetical protein